MPPPARRSTQARISRHELVRREVAAMLFVGAALVLLSAFQPAPIGAPIADVGSVSGDVRAPWFFLWVQQMLKWGDPFVWGVLVPVLVLVVLAAIPYMLPKPVAAELGHWFPRSNKLAQIILAAIAAGILVLTIMGSLPG